MINWIWRHLAFQLPLDWELLQFSRETSAGRCAFADRYAFRMEINWKVIEGQPDFDRMLIDYQALLEREHDFTNCKLQNIGPWQGLYGAQDNMQSTRYGLYLAAESCLIEIVFLWPDKYDQQLELNILNSWHHAGLSNHNTYKWQAYGMQMDLEANLVCRKIDVASASASMIFGTKDKDLFIKFQRLGMLNVWLKTKVQNWVKNQSNSQARKLKYKYYERQGHAMHSYSGVYQPKLRLKSKKPYNIMAWICPQHKRLFMQESTLPNNHRYLSCCDKFEATNG